MSTRGEGIVEKTGRFGLLLDTQPIVFSEGRAVGLGKRLNFLVTDKIRQILDGRRYRVTVKVGITIEVDFDLVRVGEFVNYEQLAARFFLSDRDAFVECPVEGTFQKEGFEMWRRIT